MLRVDTKRSMCLCRHANAFEFTQHDAHGLCTHDCSVFTLNVKHISQHHCLLVQLDLAELQREGEIPVPSTGPFLTGPLASAARNAARDAAGASCAVMVCCVSITAVVDGTSSC